MGSRKSFGIDLPTPKLRNRRGARTLSFPALRVAAAKVLEEMVVAAGEIELGVVAVVATEARVSKVHLR